MDESVTLWIAALKRGDEQAADQIWQRFFNRLQHVARGRLQGVQRVTDAEDVALSVLDTVFRGAAEGRFQQLGDRDDLWKLLVRITAQKSVDAIRHEKRQKRGGGEVRGNSVFAADRETGDFDRCPAAEPTPDFLVSLEEEHGHLLDRLRDDTLRRIAGLRMLGHSNQEISETVGISRRSVERKIGLIRQEWSRELGL